jgi:hypothetical protein
MLAAGLISYLTRSRQPPPRVAVWIEIAGIERRII